MKWINVVKAWLDGATIECRYAGDSKWVRLQPASDLFDVKYSFSDSYDYRIVKTSTGYRRYVFNLTAGGVGVHVVREDDKLTRVEDVETSKSFIKWIDLEWQYETITE